MTHHQQIRVYVTKRKGQCSEKQAHQNDERARAIWPSPRLNMCAPNVG